MPVFTPKQMTWTQVSTPQAGGSYALALTTDTSNTVNQLTSRAGGSGAMTFEGTVNEPANVTVGGQAAQVWKNGDNTFGFRAVATLAAGVNSVEIKGERGQSVNLALEVGLAAASD